MAGLQIQIGTDTSGVTEGIDRVERQLRTLESRREARVRAGLDIGDLDRRVTETRTRLDGLRTAATNAANAINGMAPRVANGGNALMQFSRIAQDAPFGIIGIGNNITATVEAFGHLRQSTGSAGGALRALAGSIMGSGGILLAVSLVTTAFTYMSQNGLTVSDVFNKLTGSFDEYGAALKKANLAAYEDSGVIKAVENVNKLRTEVDLAKKGFIDKQKVIEHYNDTIGKTTGLVSTLDGVEQQLVKNGKAYIGVQLFKATATLAQAEATKELLAREKISKQSVEEYTGILQYLKGTLVSLGNGYGVAGISAFSMAEGLKEQEKAFDSSSKKMNANLAIAEKYNKKAAAISKQKGFNFFDDTKAPKQEKTPKPKKYKNLNPNFDSGNGFLGGGIVNPNLGLITPDLGVDEAAIAANEKLRLALELQKKTIEDFNKELGSIVTSGTVNALAGIGDAIGGALASGGNVIDAVGKSILGSMGSMLQELGKATIAYGVGLIAVKAAIKNPYLAVAAGVAMVALGSAMSKSVSKSSSTALGGSGYGSVQGGNSYSSPTSSTGGGGGSSFQGGTVVFEISGQSLIGVLSNTLDKNRRLGGSLSLG